MTTTIGDGPKRVLVISDSLGTSIHARGIFHFTCSVVQTMARLGCDVSLLVEPATVGVAAAGAPLDDGSLAEAGRRYAALADVVRHYESDRFRFEWNYGEAELQRLATENPDLADFRLAMLDTAAARAQVALEVDPLARNELKLGAHSWHLRLFRELLLARGAYSESFRRAHLGLRPVCVDASGYDLVYVDTPHYVSVHGVDRSRICCVVHDFIPFFDVDMGFDWRRLFARKIECSLRVAGHLVFNSETTRRYFERIYGDGWTGRRTVIYPANREEVEEAAAEGRRPRSQYLRDIAANKRAERREWERRREADAAVPPRRRWSTAAASDAWNPDLPFFCSILSDEPRKNIGALVTASAAFRGRANFVVMGQINGDRYMGGRPGDYPNLHFTGYVSDVQKFDLLRSATGFIFPSLSEGFGIPIVEAAMFGTPVICTDTEVFREITFGRARYFAPGDDAGLRALVEELLADRAALTRGEELKRLVADAFSQAAIADGVRSLFDEAA